jgi:hypothetical protein
VANSGPVVSYDPPVTQDAVRAAERRFRGFLLVALLVVLSLSLAAMLPSLSLFWSGNRLWAFGTCLILISVLHQRYFSIVKNANPDSRILPASLRDASLRRAEVAANHAWLVGFTFLIVSRWRFGKSRRTGA